MQINKLAVETCYWPLYEVVDGKYHITYKPAKKRPIEEFLKPQKRFKHLFKPGNEWMIEELQREVDERIELSDEQIIDIISKQLKEKKMASLEFQKGNRQDLVDLTNLEMDILLEYLPKQLTQDEVDVIVKDTISEIGANSVKDIGLVMKSVMPKVKGIADGNMVNKAVRNILK